MNMPATKGKEKRQLASYLVYALLVGGFLLLCIYGKILADFKSGEWQSLCTRLGLITLVSLFVAWRFREPVPVKTPQSRRRFTLCFIFLAVLFYPLLSHFSYFSKSIREVTHSITSRHATPKEKIFALAKTFPETYEQHADKHFKLPKSFVHLDALVKVHGLGISPNNNVAVGKNGFYFEGWGARKVEKGIVENFDNIADYMGQIPFTEKELKQWTRILEERSYWLKERGINYVFVLAPTKAFVYPEYLPTSLQNAGRGQTRYEQLSNYLHKHADINFIDVRPPLLEAKAKRDYPLLFYKTDFHWNFYGAFIVYQAILNGLKQFFPLYDLNSPELDDFKLKIEEHWAHHRFIDMVGLPVFLHKNEHYITMVPKPGGPYDSALDIPPEGIHDVYPPKRTISAEDGTSMDIRLILNPEAPVRSLLLLGDSFLEKCVYFFSADAQRVLNYRTIVNFPDTIFKYEKPDIVVQEILNMFILRPPPKNPPGFRESYLRGKFKDSGKNVLLQEDSKDFVEVQQEKQRVYEIVMPKLPEMAEDEIRLAKIELSAHKKRKVSVRLYGGENKEIAVYRHIVFPESTSFFFEFPTEKVSRVTFSISNREKSSLVLQALEVRSDSDV